MARAVHIVALGARTPVGLTAEFTAAAVRAGISRLSAHPFLVDHNDDEMRSARDGRLPPTMLGWRRLVELCAAPFDEVMRKLEHGGARPGPMPLLLALPETRPGFTEEDVGATLAALRARLVTGAEGRAASHVEVAGRGHAGGLQALSAAVERIARRSADLCIVGGVDSYFEPDTVEWLIEHRQLMGQGIRDGFTPGEGAGCVALASDTARLQLRLPSLGSIAGAGVALEKKLIKTDDINLGEALSEAVRSAARELRLPAEAVDAIYCDINGERYRSEEWGFVLLKVPQVFRNTSYVAPADCWGDVGAASGPLLCTLAVRSWTRGYAAGPRALVFAGSENGLRGAVVLETPPTRA